MTALDQIKNNLRAFVKSYYTAQLLRGFILFLALGSLVLFLVLGFEYFLWLGSKVRLGFLISILLVEFYLLYRFIIVPLIYLFQLKNGLTDKQAANSIGKHFPEIDDRLSNLLDLEANDEQSELLVASIHQRAEELKPFNFSKAIDFSKSFSYAKWIAIPLFIFSVIYFFGDIRSFFQSYQRVINYDLAYAKPAPFNFVLLNDDLLALQNESTLISVETIGDLQPEAIAINLAGEEYLMKNNNGVFQYEIKSPKESFTFYFSANGFTSNSYNFKVIKTPTILDFILELSYPKYTHKNKETLSGVGSATVLEGTKVSWKVATADTDRLLFKGVDTIQDFMSSAAGMFSLSKAVYNSLKYSISTSNKNVSDFENLEYSFEVVKDEFPKITVIERKDSLVHNKAYYSGNLSDDYGVSSLKLYYFNIVSPDSIMSLELLKPNSPVSSFYYTFPSGINIVSGNSYAYYFQVSDNDQVNGSKHSKSQTFTTTMLGDNQLKNKELESQQAIISSLDKTVEKLKNQTKAMEELSGYQKEKSSLSFNDKSKLNSLLQKHELQENQMQKFSKQLKDNLNKANKDDGLNKLLQERLERQELQAKKNKELIESLKKVADKINKEDLSKRLDDLAKNQKSGQRNLEQLLELTKRYYVTEAASQLSKDLDELSRKEMALAKSKLNDIPSKADQEKINELFRSASNKLEELKKDNNNLKKPISLGIEKWDTDSLTKDLNNISEQLDKESNGQKSSSSSARQKSAAEKIKELSEALSESSSTSGGSNVTEDAEVLRQILDNLVIFTFKQEAMIDDLSDNENAFANTSKVILKQQELKTLCAHVDDSLFALSLRVPEISETINREVTELYYNLDNVVENLSESRIYQSVSYQKYVLNSGNILSDLLANILDNMQESMKSGKGEGSGEDFQLPDIIKGQSDLNKKMGQAGQGKDSTKGESGSSGKNGQKGEEGQQGSQGKNGTSGKQGKGGKDGESGSSGSNGKESNGGTSGSGEGDSNGDGEGNGQSDGKGNGKGGAMGNGNTGLSEDALKEIYQIYKEQELLKNKLEQQLSNMINKEDRSLGQKLIRQMNDFQNSLLENGVTRSTIDKATIIQYELIKLEGAAMKQGEKKERESNTNSNSFRNPVLTQPAIFDNYKNQNEILNRQALPLRQNYQNRIKEYFNTND
ncbi:hypothetical protein [Cellulophaga baltica]|uniref:hypothetical protein n=1 Tax=Cellulophaga baltica TaxID=76594 RepID=UPI0015F61F69|nr:hypothetical protein [Cellulophaga baltica]MBA6313837.1 hypothetical protein [Cellulophaga baltica]